MRLILPAGRLPPLRVNGAPVAGVLPVSAAASCPGVVAHIVSEQVMAAHAKSKVAANLLRLGFIDFSFGFWVFGFYIRAASLFGSRTNVFLLGKAETAAKTRQVFSRAAADQGAIPSALFSHTAVESTRPKAIARLRCRLTSTSKAAASTPLTAAEVRTTLAYSGSTAIPNGLGQLGMNCWFTFCPSRSAWPIELPSLAQ